MQGPKPQEGSVCLAGNSWLNADVIDAALARLGAARRLRASPSIDRVGLDRVCAVDGARADDEWLGQCDVASVRDLPRKGTALLRRLRKRHNPADIDIYLLPVNVVGGHWYLLSADVRGSQCVVRVHEPYGKDVAELRAAAGKGFSKLLWSFLHPDGSRSPSTATISGRVRGLYKATAGAVACSRFGPPLSAPSSMPSGYLGLRLASSSISRQRISVCCAASLRR